MRGASDPNDIISISHQRTCCTASPVDVRRCRWSRKRFTVNHKRQRRRGYRGRDPPPIFDLHGSSCVDDHPIF